MSVPCRITQVKNAVIHQNKYETNFEREVSQRGDTVARLQSVGMHNNTFEGCDGEYHGLDTYVGVKEGLERECVGGRTACDMKMRVR